MKYRYVCYYYLLLLYFYEPSTYDLASHIDCARPGEDPDRDRNLTPSEASQSDYPHRDDT
jgi:hypothetical protein